MALALALNALSSVGKYHQDIIQKYFAGLAWECDYWVIDKTYARWVSWIVVVYALNAGVIQLTNSTNTKRDKTTGCPVL